MKLLKISAFAACALMLASCGGHKTVELGKDATPSDSIGYLLGEMLDAQHLQYADTQDTTMKDKKALDAYSEGFIKGLELLKSDNEAYNKGMMDAITAHMQVLAVNKELGSEISVDAVVSGFKAAGHKKMDPAQLQKIQTQLMELTNRMQADKNKNMTKQATAKASELAKKQGFKATKDGVRYKVTKAGAGDNLKNGQNIKANITVKDKDGKDVMPSMPDVSLTVGNVPFSPLLEKALPMLKVGSEYLFITTPADMFGEQLPPQMDASEPIYFNIEVTGIDEDAQVIELPADNEAR